MESRFVPGRLSTESLQHIINHVFLPPKLPQEDDLSVDNDLKLITAVLEALKDFSVCLNDLEVSATLKITTSMIDRMISAAPNGTPLENLVEKQMNSMMVNDVLAFNVKAQNAALLIRCHESKYIFEAFEVSCPNASVTGTKGRLNRIFPQEAIMISSSIMSDPAFRLPFSDMLVDLAKTTPEDAYKISRKAQRNLPEIRDVIDPRYFTELAFGILRGIGTPVEIPRIEKRAQDEVLWSDTYCCWRRSPLWTVLRVAIQTTLMRQIGPDRGCAVYKAFMIHFMTRLLMQATRGNMCSDILYTMHRKIVRRLHKLSEMNETESFTSLAGKSTWGSHIENTIEASYKALKCRWHQLESCADPFKTQSAWDVSRLSFQDDTYLKIKTLRSSLDAVLHRPPQSYNTREADIGFSARISKIPNSLPNINALAQSTGQAQRILLCDIEMWIQDCLVDWTDCNLSKSDVCSDLATLMTAYSTAGRACYVDDQEGLSRMFLVVMELWVCLDRIVTRHEPMLLDHPIGFAPDLFDPLLLPSKSQMARLAAVESYLTSRRQSCRAQYPSIFNAFGDSNSLPVRYFDGSEKHQELHRTIEREANTVRASRLELFRAERHRYNDLSRKANQASHERIQKSGWDWYNEETISWEENACPHCQKCRWEKEAAGLKIRRHEWPLPSKLAEAKTAVFELDCPKAISVWRDMTYFVMVDVLTSPQNLPRDVPATGKYGLENYDALRAHFISDQNRIVIRSATKPIHVSHYRDADISSATEQSICVEHAMQYDIHDSRNEKAAHKFIGYADVRKACSQPIMDKNYEGLQSWVDNTTHQPNEVIAKQSECPLELSVHEYLSFGHLRSGPYLQWHNIARALIDGTLNFNTEAVSVILAQCAWQAGPCCAEDDPTMRASHGTLSAPPFCLDLLDALEELLSNTKENWQGIMSIQILVTLTSRILSLASHKDVRQKCLDILCEARNVTFAWTRKLKEKLSTCFEENERKQWMDVSIEIALCCYSTFALDLPDIELLLTSEDLVAKLTECMITIDELRPTSIGKLPRHMRSSLLRFSRVAQIVEEVLCRVILRNGNGLNRSITSLWESYSPGSPWQIAVRGQREWLMTKTAETTDSGTVPVYFNLLTGSLLVNGSPLTRLPTTYERNASYLRLFSKMYITVIPSTMRGMRYESRTSVFGYQVHFLLDGPNLVICARKESETFRILPTDLLFDDFPPAFISGYSHWLNLSTKELEFRPITNPWVTCKSNWRIQSLGDATNILSLEKLLHLDMPTITAEKLLHIDMHTITAHRIYQVLSPIERREHIHISYHPASQSVDVHLIRLRLDFFINGSGVLECRQRRNMEVDKNQSCGTFTGVRNKLILRSNKDSHRCIIVPFGEVKLVSRENHTEVQVETSSESDIEYFYYELDITLRRLKDNDSMKSCLFRTLLHATSSHCLPDCFTGRTGTEQAIANLKDASTLSFRTLSSEEIQILVRIGQLTPHRVYYPQHMAVMQEVKWHTVLPPLSQHESFYSLVSDIFKCARAQKMFYTTEGLPDEGRFGEPALLARAEIRNSIFRGIDYGGEKHSTVHDKAYQESTKTKEASVCGLTSLVNAWPNRLSPPSTLLSIIEDWEGTLRGQNASSHHDSLRYNHTWKGTPDIMLNSTYNLGEGYEPTQTALKYLINSAAKDFSQCPEALLPALRFEKKWQSNDRRRGLHTEAKESKANQLVDQLLLLWPTDTINIANRSIFATHFNLDQISESANTRFASWFRNRKFKTFISQAQSILNRHRTSPRHTAPYNFSRLPQISRKQTTHLDWKHLFSGEPPSIEATGGIDMSLFLRPSASMRDCQRVRRLIERGRLDCIGTYETNYMRDMLRSLDHLRTIPPGSHLDRAKEDLLREALGDACIDMESKVDTALEAVRKATIRRDSWSDSIAALVTTWPRMQPTALLKHLTQQDTLSPGWTNAILQYGILITRWQYYRRLSALPLGTAEFLKEFKNVGHDGWDPAQYPEWLLFEIENNLLIRPEQAQVAKEMLKPSCKSNCVMQLNMGEGKSSVIAPIVAATLAKGQYLPRMIVLPSLFAQMFHLLREKLGGLMGHRVVGVPFSRSTPMSSDEALVIHEMYERLLRERCIVLCQPEHILSFDLMGIEKSNSTIITPLASTLVKTQRWIDENTRDILDESDEILNVKFELIYTMGQQTAIDFSPQRWEVIASVLRRLRHRLRDDARAGKQPEGLSVQDTRPEGFPRLQILEQNDGEDLMKRVVYDLITEGGVQGLPLLSLNSSERQSLIHYILDPKAPGPSKSIALERIFSSPETRSILLLLKGLFGHGVLLFVFQQKRWRVNYGHDFSRSLLAVPYRAKDLPASRAEFSHPDATILLTCLSYYYKGLTNDQLFQCFDELLRSDDSTGQYASWTSEVSSMPDAFRALSGVNLKDRLQCTMELFPRIRNSKAVVDFFMSRLVFPNEMKEFPSKLSSSGWDIAQVKRHPTTGFSGTNDSRYLLPLSVQQYDIPDQVHTNATVLECILQPHNTYQVIPGAGNAKSLLDLVVGAQPEIRVILDVGALVLEWRNDEMARNWLERIPSDRIEGVVYFDENDEVMVLTRDGRIQLLQESPMQKQMDTCLVYLDEAHTRGTDLKLPSDYRAAATLGLGLSKDRLVQACMRMRKLAHGQSVMLCAPMEIERKIRQHAKKVSGAALDVEDVLLWSIQNTHHYTKKCVPLWAIQGMRHQRRKVVWSGEGNSQVLLEPESKSLEDWYGVVGQPDHPDWLQRYGPDVLSQRSREVQKIQRKMKDFETSSIDDAALHEEQERELSPECELQRQREVPPTTDPVRHSLHRDIVVMVREGRLNTSSVSLIPAFKTLQVTKMAQVFDLSTWPTGLWATKDFARTVRAVPTDRQDYFVRSPQWLLRWPETETCVLISAFEANSLLPEIQKAHKLTLHIYTPRIRDSAGASRTMDLLHRMENLQYCVVPSLTAQQKTPQAVAANQATKVQLNLFAGQLYFESQTMYEATCCFLGLAFRGPCDGVTMSPEGFIEDTEDRLLYDERMAKQCSIHKSPVELLRKLATCRRKGQRYKNSHMGLLLDGDPVEVGRLLGS
ncbi:hypothetical protein EJ05DRAFT_463267 [Pseudovirgaria hyperparasitica]|uniref:ubiquitinyl hydrolase 1 n=1 Tax=Pseudovirgaria hyperparasitica TaxID=470096 RepID=A0A6A6WFH1_9PEZI|nr:uncharacterized protein EJ05DRAFT_463267 [Pseudovirgaria hyperparasitica]KAF2759861.1 hypothetical protein EJ05DRAFT_463267 [Pseudovirgaria hyperparasitica]